MGLHRQRPSLPPAGHACTPKTEFRWRPAGSGTVSDLFEHGGTAEFLYSPVMPGIPDWQHALFQGPNTGVPQKAGWGLTLRLALCQCLPCGILGGILLTSMPQVGGTVWWHERPSPGLHFIFSTHQH